VIRRTANFSTHSTGVAASTRPSMHCAKQKQFFPRKEDHTALQRLLVEGGGSRRTRPWNKRPHAAVSKSVDEEDWKPLSTILHDRSKEITGNFDKSSIIVKKKKPKTHAESQHHSVTAPTAEERPSQAPRFRVNKNVYPVLKTLFHI
jgi:hypothetical protein